MAPPPDTKRTSKPVPADDDLDLLPIQKTSPVVYGIAAVAAAVVIGLVGFSLHSKSQEREKAAAAAASIESALQLAARTKAERDEKARQADLAYQTLGAAQAMEGQGKPPAAASTAAVPPAADAPPTGGGKTPAAGTAVAGATPPAGGDPAPAPTKPKRGSASSKDADDLDKLGGATNTALGGK